jgi:hypothetical protein
MADENAWLRRLGAVLAACATACGDAGTSPEVVPGEIVRIEVTPSFARLTQVGETVRFLAEGVRADGQREQISPVWSSRDTAILSIDSEGRATAHRLGVLHVDAATGALMAAVMLVIDPDVQGPELVDLFVDQTSVNVLRGPATVTLQAEFRDDTGVRSALAFFEAPSGASVTGLVELQKIVRDTTGYSGVGRAGASVFRGSLGIPGTVGGGTWTLTSVSAIDGIGNPGRWGVTDLEAIGLSVVVEAVLNGNGGG